MKRRAIIVEIVVFLLLWAALGRSEILWSDEGSRLVHDTGPGVDILGGKIKRDDNSSDALYFRVHVDPLSDVSSEPYFAGFQLYENDTPHLGVGNAMEAWGYSAYETGGQGPSNKLAGEFNLKSSHPETYRFGINWPYELVKHDVERTIIFKVQYVPGGDDLVTVWLNPDLGRGASDKNQRESLTTKFKAKATFNEIRLRHGKGETGDGGHGWIFSEMAIATSFDDFVVVRFWQEWWFLTLVAVSVLVGVGGTVRVVEQRKYRHQLQLAEQTSALERERARIAQDLHDDLGSSLTRISLLSGLLRADKDHPDQVESHAAKLSQSADQTVRALEEIVWAVRPGSDTLQSLVDYIAHFANEISEDERLPCRLDLPDELPPVALPPEMRHNIFLIVKEALTNALKHSAASEALVQTKVNGRMLEVVVRDNGRGFDPLAGPKGNGLGNMRRRAEEIQGILTVDSEAKKGTVIRLTVRIASSVIHPNGLQS